jgi:predicted DNA binding CopG/RHH family protein
LDAALARSIGDRDQLLQTRRQVVAKSIDMRVVGDQVEEDPEVSEMVTRLESEADREIAAGTVTLRWGREQIGVVKRAAAIMGVPYQTYLKLVVFRQALADIERASAVLGHHQGTPGPAA